MTNERIPKKMGRPKKCPIQIMRTKTLCRSLCYEQKIPCNAYQFEKVFETTTYVPREDDTIQRKQKFYRLFNGVHTISESTLKQISEMENTENSLALYYSSLWEALSPHNTDFEDGIISYDSLYLDKTKDQKIQNCQLNAEEIKEKEQTLKERQLHWLRFFKTLRPSLQAIALKCDDDGMSEIKGVNQFTCKQLLKEGDIEALACAIAIHRASPLHVRGFKLSSAIAKLAGWILANPAFKDSKKEILNILVNKYRALDADVSIYDRNFCHSLNRPGFGHFDLINKNREYIKRCVKLGIDITPKNLKHIFVTSEKGNKQLIFEEMGIVLNHQEYELADSSNGLRWLISDLNKNLRNKLCIN